MNEIKFFVPCVPIAQPRQRHRIAGKPGAQFVQNYTPADSAVNTFKSTIRLAARVQTEGPLWEGPLSLIVTFIMPRPKTMMWKSKLMPRQYHDHKPDLDNLMKALKDALTQIVWVDDSQVCVEHSFKVIAAGNESPGVHVEIAKLGASV